MKIGDKVKVEFEMMISSTSYNYDHPDRSFICGDVLLDGHHESHDKYPFLKKEAFASGIPISKVKI